MREAVRRTAMAAAILATALAAACGGEGAELREATRAREAERDGGAAAAESIPGPPALDTAPAPAGALPVLADTVPTVAIDSGAPSTPAPSPAPAPPAAPADTAAKQPPAAPTMDWTAGARQQRRRTAGLATLSAVRTARNPGFDRVVFEFAGELPGWRVEYVDRPVRRCGSGDATEVAGQGWLRVRFTPAQAHDGRGRPTVGVREVPLTHAVMRELELTCDFEGEVTWVVGVASPNRYRVVELRDPARIAVDVLH